MLTYQRKHKCHIWAEHSRSNLLLQVLWATVGHVTRMSSLLSHANLLCIVSHATGNHMQLTSGVTDFSHPTLAATFISKLRPHMRPDPYKAICAMNFGSSCCYINSYSEIWRLVSPFSVSHALIAHHSPQHLTTLLHIVKRYLWEIELLELLVEYALHRTSSLRLLLDLFYPQGYW